MRYIIFGIFLFVAQSGLVLLRDETITTTRAIDMAVISLIFVLVIFFSDKKDKKNKDIDMDQ